MHFFWMRNNLFFIILNIYIWGQKKDCEEEVDTEANCEGIEFVEHARERETLFVMQTHYP